MAFCMHCLKLRFRKIFRIQKQLKGGINHETSAMEKKRRLDGAIRRF